MPRSVLLVLLHRFVISSLLIAGFLAPAPVLHAAAELEVVSERWGFDSGRVVPGELNPLHIVLHNKGDEPFSGVVTVSQSFGTARAGVPHSSGPVTIVPGGRTRVSFLPYVANPEEVWTVRWGRGLAVGSHEVQPPKKGGLARVFLLPDGVSTVPRGMVGFPESLFPDSVTGTDSLGVVILDHDPAWGPARRRALLDWIHRGGTLHILRDDLGERVELGGELARLDLVRDRRIIGGGEVVRHDLTRRDPLPPELQRGDVITTDAFVMESTSAKLLAALGRFSDPEHWWSLLFFLSGLFMVLIGPVNLWLGRKVFDYRGSLLFFLAMVALFSFLFLKIGQRGYGERQRLSVLTLARPISDDRLDLTQWSNIFVTERSELGFRHRAAGNAYDTIIDAEAVDGLAQTDGGIGVRLPVFSSAKFFHRGTVPWEPLIEDVVATDTGGWPMNITLRTGPGFPERTLGMWVLVNGRLYHLDRIGASRLRAESKNNNLRGFISEGKTTLDRHGAKPSEGRIRAALQGLAVRRIIDRSDLLLDCRQGAGREVLDVFVLAPRPPELAPLDDDLAQEGYVLFHIPIPRESE